MAEIGNLVRHKRFKVLSNYSISLTIGTENLENLTIDISDCSITGMFGQLTNISKSTFSEGTIFPNSKLTFNNHEIPLGRLILRRIVEIDQSTYLALSTIDSRLPIGGLLSKGLNLNFDGSTSEFETELSDEGFTLADFLTTSFNNVDILDRCEKFELFYKNYKDSNRYAYFFAKKSNEGPRVKVKKSGANKSKEELLMFGSNDYLSLSCHPEVIEAQKIAAEKYGVGSSGSAPTSGTTILHQQLCEKVAKLYNRSEALVFPSGYAANIGIIAGIARPEDLVVADQISHASIQDGMKMSGATNRFYKHNNMGHLQKVLERDRSKHSGCLIITEGIFSMDGTIGQLDEIISIARRYNSRVMVDQGHCFGVLGDNFLGASEHFNVVDEVDITLGLFSKSVGTFGAFVTGPAPLMHWYKAYARSLMFATSFPPGIAAASIKSLEIISTGKFQKKLFQNIQRFVTGLIKIGVPISTNHNTPVIPVEIGDETKMGEIFQDLLSNGIFALPVMFPVVPKNRCRFRFSITANFSLSDIDYTLLVLKNAIEKHDVTFKK